MSQLARVSFMLLFWNVWLGSPLLAQVVNSYFEVIAVDICTNELVLADATDLAANDQVLIIQMQGATIDESNSGNFGDIADLNAAGGYELNRIASVTGNIIQFERTFRHEYESAGLQLIRYQTEAALTVEDTLFVPPWDGTTGGILFIDVEGTLTLEAPIIGSGRGFRGAESIGIGSSCRGGFFPTDFRDAFYPAGNFRGAPKGEGVARPIPEKEWGRGAQANGGGGGNDHNSGGGGGGNVAFGGEGGENNRPNNSDCQGQRPGLSGRGLPVFADHLYLGGGGGAGHRNNNNPSDGGNGGGIIMVRANTVNFATEAAALISDGDSAVTVTGDGAGGGGAGGTILLLAETIEGTLRLQARGGAGGTVDNRMDLRSMGPGGGGSGGHVIGNFIYPADLTGGATGLSINSGAGNRPDSPNQAFAGEDGIPSQIDSLPMGPIWGPIAINTLSNDTAFCGKPPLSLQVAVENAAAFQWEYSSDSTTFEEVAQGSNYEGVNTATLDLQDDYAPGFYRLRIARAPGCPAFYSDTLEVQTDVGPLAGFTFETDASVVTFTNTSERGTTYQWDFGNGAMSMAADTTIDFNVQGSYPVQLIAENACGTDTILQIVTVVESGVTPIPLFDFDTTSGCAPLIVTFTNRSENSDSVQWEFPGGDPENASADTVQVTYDTPGSYSMQITAFGNGGANVTAKQNLIQVEPAPNVSFNANINGNEVDFSATIENVESFVWAFGDGNGSTEQNPSHTYAESGTYTVTLSYSNDLCGPGEVLQTITIGEVRPPQAEISSNTVSGCAPLTVAFENASTGDYTDIRWSFEGGEPATSAEETPSVTYPLAGNYAVELIASGPAGDDTTAMTVFVSAGPQAAFAAEVEETTITLENNSVDGLTYEWDFGDGNSSSDDNPTHTYAQSGTYTVQLITSNGCGADTLSQQVTVMVAVPGPQAAFELTPITGCEPLTVRFTNQSTAYDSVRWNFPGGEPASSTGEVVEVTYATSGTYSAELIAFGNGLTDTLFQQNGIRVDMIPEAAFTFEVDGRTVQFTGIVGSAETVRWEFGDGATSTAVNPVHTYTSDGDFTVLLIVGNATCGQTEASQQILIGNALRAQFSTRSLGACAPLRVQFENQSLGEFDQVEWFFDGGEPQTSTEESPTVFFTEPGAHLVRLTISGPSGTISDSSFIEITAPPNPNFEFTLDGFTVQFEDLSSGADRYSWNFGDGQTSTEVNPVHTYAQPGVYDVTLNLQNGRCGRSTSRTVAIGVTDVTDLAGAGIRIYPNPVSDRLQIEGMQAGNVRLYDAGGRTLLQRPLFGGGGTLDLGAVPSGMYLLFLEDARGQWLVRILKQ